MINEQNAYAFCKDDIRLIENYDKAINDKSQMWECHHRKGLDYSSQWLKDNGLYYHQPASDLIFITKREHRRLHNKGKHLSAETIAKISETLTGKTQSEETKAKRSATLKGHPNWGPEHHTDETKKLISERVKANLPDTVFKPGHTTWNKGIPMAADSKEKMRKKLIGRKNGPRSEETKEKIRLAKIGKHHSKETRLKLSKRVVQYTKDFVFVKEWESVKAAAEALGSPKIGTVCNGHREFAAGFRWFFKEDLYYFF